MPDSNVTRDEPTEPPTSPDGRLYSPSIARNKEPILNILKDILHQDWSVLEIACGTGEHGAFFASKLEEITWLPTDVSDAQFDSVNSWRRAHLGANILAPITIDASAPEWTLPQGFVVDAIVCINMIHITPWTVTMGLLAGAGKSLPNDGVLFLYGPFTVDQEHTAPSNAAFDASLKGRNKLWGIRDLADVVKQAETCGLQLERRVPMPANNFSLIFRKHDQAAT